MNNNLPTTVGLEAITIREATQSDRWKPAVGRELQALLRRKKLIGRDAQRVEGETCRILSKCVPPDSRGDQRTGLVIGYVQSGKTLSFTALTALARDNRYRLVIVLGGTTTNLVDQSCKRLADDLDIEGEGQRLWAMYANPRLSTAADIGQAIRSWTAYPEKPDRCPTVVIVVMKNHKNLLHLAGLLKDCELDGVSTLIVDDEGDQAGLNNKVRQKEESTTYKCIQVLRRVFRTHTYLMYTATPQAPLLISRIDMLSPQFAEVIEPGEGYVGGKDLFRENSPYIEIIPATELPDDESEKVPPASLEKALRLFFVGVAAGWVEGGRGNRSMMVHPSHIRDWHKTFVAWVRSARTAWLNILRDTPNSPDRRTLIEDFRAAHADLAATDSTLPPFEKIVGELVYGIDETQVVVINASAGRIPTVNWKHKYGFILVGGTGLDRGFTVEGLTVTYMPRGAGVGNADTVQQRGRFFGYKREYMGLIRIFLESSVSATFQKYVEHEKSVRGSLVAFRDTGKPLAEWRRAFFLDRSMSPTRSSVLSLDYMRNRGRDWIYPRQPQNGDRVLEQNRRTVTTFVESLSAHFKPAPGSKLRTEEQRHTVASRVPLTVAYQQLLVPLVSTGDDLLDQLHVRLQIERVLERDSDATCDIYRMSPEAKRFRGLDKDKAIKNLMQGANEKTGYPGDRAIRNANTVTIQIHSLELRAEKNEGKRGKDLVVSEDVPVIAVAIPEAMRADALVETIDD